MEEQTFALMLRHVLTHYDFECIDAVSHRASVQLRREVYAENGIDENLRYEFSDPVLIRVLENLKAYLPSI